MVGCLLSPTPLLDGSEKVLNVLKTVLILVGGGQVALGLRAPMGCYQCYQLFPPLPLGTGSCPALSQASQNIGGEEEHVGWDMTE